MTFPRIPQLAARAFLAAAAGFFALPSNSAPGEALARSTSVDTLRDKYAQVRDRLEKNPYGRPLWLDSRDLSGKLQGDAYAVVTQPFAKVQAALAPASSWCEVLMMPFNTKSCAAKDGHDTSRLSLFVGRKSDTPVESTFRLDFDYALTARTADYLEVVLKAGDGPLGTRDYHILLEAIPLDESRTFLHFGYAYSYGMVSKLAMQVYLATAGASKVGFSTEGREGNGQPRLVGGMRGVMERNTMRYYLAIDAFLATTELPPATRVTRRLNDWFSATERYPRQLGEDIGRIQYLAMKQREYARMGTPPRVAGT